MRKIENIMKDCQFNHQKFNHQEKSKQRNRLNSKVGDRVLIAVGSLVGFCCLSFSLPGLATTNEKPVNPSVTDQRFLPKLLIPKSQPQPVIERRVVPEFGQHFQDLKVEGSIIIYDPQKNQIYEHNPKRNQTPFSPASTFKILNSLISLDAQVIPDQDVRFTWDGIQRPFPGWNQDLNMREAFKVSAVWFYQILARRIGYERMKAGVIGANYGDRNIGDPANIDQFWLSGPLKITPEEQIQFLQRLYLNQLPFSERSIAIVKDIMIMDQTAQYTVRAKTGWAMSANPQIGWYVGYLEQNQQVYFFATNLELPEPAQATARKEITYRCLRTLGLL